MNHKLLYHWLARLAALLAGAMIIFGAFHFIVMTDHMPGLDLASQSPTGLSNIRVFGAFHLGVGLIAIGGALRAQWTRAALAAITVVGLSVFALRLYGLSVDGATDMSKTIALREGAFLLVALIGFLFARPAAIAG